MLMDFFATLNRNRGEKNYKLNLRYAYQQLILVVLTIKLLTASNHNKLFEPTCVQFGVPSVWQPLFRGKWRVNFR